MEWNGRSIGAKWSWIGSITVIYDHWTGPYNSIYCIADWNRLLFHISLSQTVVHRQCIFIAIQWLCLVLPYSFSHCNSFIFDYYRFCWMEICVNSFKRGVIDSCKIIFQQLKINKSVFFRMMRIQMYDLRLLIFFSLFSVLFANKGQRSHRDRRLDAWLWLLRLLYWCFCIQAILLTLWRSFNLPQPR